MTESKGRKFEEAIALVKDKLIEEAESLSELKGFSDVVIGERIKAEVAKLQQGTNNQFEIAFKEAVVSAQKNAMFTIQKRIAELEPLFLSNFKKILDKTMPNESDIKKLVDEVVGSLENKIAATALVDRKALKNNLIKNAEMLIANWSEKSHVDLTSNVVMSDKNEKHSNKLFRPPFPSSAIAGKYGYTVLEDVKPSKCKLNDFIFRSFLVVDDNEGITVNEEIFKLAIEMKGNTGLVDGERLKKHLNNFPDKFEDFDDKKIILPGTFLRGSNGFAYIAVLEKDDEGWDFKFYYEDAEMGDGCLFVCTELKHISV